MTTQNAASHIQAAVQAVLRDAEMAGGAAPLAERVHAYLWPYVREAVDDALSQRGEAPAAAQSAKRDRRARPWQYAAYFWQKTETGPVLIGETDPAIMHGTGELPVILANLSAELHEGTPDALKPDAVKERLPQFRNNLGRSNAATLRIEYVFDDTAYLAQVDVLRLEE